MDITTDLDTALVQSFSRWIELRMAQLQPGLAQLLADLGRIDTELTLDEQVRQVGADWARIIADGGTRLNDFLQVLGLNHVDGGILLTLWVLGENLQLDALRRQGFNDDAFFEARLVARVLGADTEKQARVMGRLGHDAPLRKLSLVHLNAPASRPRTALRNRFIELDESVAAFFEKRDHWPEELRGVVERFSDPDVVGRRFFDDQLNRLERALSVRSDANGTFVALCTTSLETSRALALCWAARHERPLFQFTMARALRSGQTLDLMLPLLAREARKHNALVLIDAGRTWDDLDPGIQDALLGHLPTLSVLSGSPVVLDAPLKGEENFRRHLNPLFEVRTLPPTLEEQVDIWEEALQASDLEPLPARELREQVCDLALEVGDIQRAVRLSAQNQWLIESDPAEPSRVEAGHLRAMAASKLNQGMQAVAERVMSTLTWSDLILPDEVLEGMNDVITYARYQRQVFEGWGFGSKMPYGRANSCLFSGPPGTGKTMAAGVIARELGMDLFRVDLSNVVSKWVGETEKNLSRVFDEASRGHAVLLFDEADSLFGKRTAVKSSNDRHNNMQVNYLLQRMESFEGITVLTTNLADSIDEAFARRIKFKVSFPVPDAPERARLWKVMLPRDAEREADIDWEHLGDAFEMAGAHIKNVVLRAAFRAAESGMPISTAMLEAAGILELREMGKLVRVDDNGRLVTPEPQIMEALPMLERKAG